MVGNLQVGGLGKTPVVARVAELLQQAGEQVVISASGYGSPASRAAQLVPDGPLDPAVFGDEVALLRRLLPNIPIVAGRRRVLAAEITSAKFPDSILLLDDGLQHKPLGHHASILLDEEHVPNPFVLPAGPYREPRSNRRRYSLILPRDFRLLGFFDFYDLHTGNVVERPNQVQVLTAIARPWRVVNTAEHERIEVVTGRYLPDHDPLNAPNLFKSLVPGLPILTTEKDAVKLIRRPDAIDFPILVMRMRIEIENEPEFMRQLMGQFAKH